MMSKLDRFLVSADWLDLYPKVCQLALPKPASDHCPILLDSNYERWGLTTFRFELMWLEQKNFPELIAEWWKEFRVTGWAGFKLASKQKLLKGKRSKNGLPVISGRWKGPRIAS